jgi:hypothetical protein
MPLIKGKSKKVQAQNFREAWASYKRTGKFGNTTPKNDAHARRIITAAVLGQAGVTKTNRKK